MHEQTKYLKSCLVIASGNVGKIYEFRRLLADFPLTIHGQPEGLHVEETGNTFLENARLKALAVANATGKCSLADDSGLSVDHLAGAPGVHSARYASTDEGRISRLLREMETCKNRSAHFSSAICIASPNNEILLEVEGRCEGLITNKPRGSKGFGYDPIFEVLDTGLTFAEMGIEKKQLLSHRGRAFALLKPGLTNLLQL
ncbi:RdgB/HAM1 family non-canonical purine NTP pyrophosphatase [Prochlorococcus sp. MIT 1307]|uniref:RdgB/HAM1 family non-canonical purine NTP pyrophosphatase n=1 Tax=Prochlorococcus sp. MIT 1307 TaxID=3096219 RepID=UPI002A74FFDA|nr:RdgB/HAM1 family non-canonical purine NTP pyrophosphatase [Prochlorococcus sp. MIT 1307]